MGHGRVAFLAIDPTTLSKDPEMKTMVTDLGDGVVGYLQIDDDSAEHDEEDDNPDTENLPADDREAISKGLLRELLPKSTISFLLSTAGHT